MPSLRCRLFAPLLFTLVLALSACGGSAAPPGGLYLGYYHEDPATNREDPMLGAMYMELPANDATFRGNMFFTYVGCQTSNVGIVEGTRANNQLTGSWSGTIDGTAQSGPYAGTWSAGTQTWSGTYNVAGGKQFIDIDDCISYFIAPNGTWELFPLEQSVPADFSVRVAEDSASWTPVADSSAVLTYVVDAAVAESGSGNATVWQTILAPGANSTSLTPAELQKGKEYIIVVVVMDGEYNRRAFGCRRFTAL